METVIVFFKVVKKLMGMKPAKVSIVICTYNRCEELEKTLQSICAVTYEPFEVIVVDNNSTDDTKRIVEKYPVQYIMESKQGVAHARNRGLEASCGEFVGFIDDDESVNTDWIVSILKGFTLDRSVGAVTGPVIPQYMETPPVWMTEDFHGSTGGADYRLLSSSEAIGTGNSMFRSDLVKNIRFKTALGRVKNSLISGEDTEFVQQLYDRGYKGAYSPEAIVYHRIPPERTTLSWFMKRYFAEGITEYLRKGQRVFWRRLHKPVVDVVALLLSIFSFSSKRIIARWLRLCQTAGILYGPIYKEKNSRNL